MFFIIARFFVFIYLRILYRFEISGTEHIPQSGGVVICSNHLNANDPLVIVTSIKRRAFFLGKKELFTINKFLTALFLKLGAFPVDRDKPDMRAYKWALDLLKNEQVLGIFSQGTRKTMDASAAKNGAALFAIKAGVPIVPCGISGSYKLFSKVTIKYGAPVSLEEYQGAKPKTELLDTVMAEVMAKVSGLTNTEEGK